MIDWTHWHNEPYLIGGLIFLGWLYAILTGPLRAKLTAISYQPSAADSDPQVSGLRSQVSLPPPYPLRQAIMFYSGLVIFYLAVGSPLDQAGERYLLSAHMVQHQLIIYPAAVLFLLGLPDWLIRPITARPVLRPLLRILTNPVVCGAIYTATLTVWHVPTLYDLALQNRVVHIAEHFSFFGAALFYWWPLLSPSKDFPPASYAWQMLYLPAVIIAMTPVFAFITFSPDVLYPTYEFAPRITYLSAAADQLLAGAMMKLVGMAVAMIAFGISFYRWYADAEKENPALGRK
jgi:putative membrane protein